MTTEGLILAGYIIKDTKKEKKKTKKEGRNRGKKENETIYNSLFSGTYLLLLYTETKMRKGKGKLFQF